MKPAVVVAAHDRPWALQRLLTSIQRAHHPPGVKLVISIDPGGQHEAEVRRIAEDFAWEARDKVIIQHEKHLGLIGNVFFCGDLTREYGSIILLEDDLYVSPMYYRYSSQALRYYEQDPRIAGISLNALWFNGYTHLPFEPYLDDSDHFFLQVAWFQGQAYTKAQWQAFDDWRHGPNVRVKEDDPMHELFMTFPESDWFPLKTKYLVDNDRYYLLPRQSMSSNFGEAGTHFYRSTRFFQVPLQTKRSTFRWLPFDEAVAVYDSFQELLPDRLNRLTTLLRIYDYDIDLNGTKSRRNLRADYVLTTKGCQSPIFTFGMEMRPLVANVVEEVPGKGISFCRTVDLEWGRWARWQTDKRNYDYFQLRHRLGRWPRIRLELLRLLEKLDMV